MINRLHPLISSLLVALAYFITGRFGLMLPAFGSSITLVWLPTGIAVASLLRFGYGCWPGIAVGAAAVNLAVGIPLSLAVGIAVGNTLAPLFTAWALQRMRFRPEFDRQRDILLLALAALVGMLISASLGTFLFARAGRLPGNPLFGLLLWWAGDSMGVMSAAPLALSLDRRQLRAILVRRGEFFLWLIATAAVTWLTFVVNRAGVGEAWSLGFLPLPFVAWAALRYGPVGTSLALILVSAVAAYGTAKGLGPFHRREAIESVTLLWVFMATASLLGWLIAALQAARVHATAVQQLFERALTDVSLGAVLSGLDHRVTFASEGFTRLTGYTEPEILGKTCAILHGPETDLATVNVMREALRNAGHFDGEVLNYCKDGTPFWNALLISPVTDEHGLRTGFIGIQRDITQRKKTELALHHSEEHLRTIVALEPECVKLLSTEGEFLEMNPAGLKMVEAATLDEIRGGKMLDFVVREDRERVFVILRRALNGETVSGEFLLRGRFGALRAVESHLVPYHDAKRQIVGVLGIMRDITHRQRTEAALRQSEESFRTLTANQPDVVVRLDRERRHLYANPAIEAATGIPAQAFLGKTYEELGMPEANTTVWKAALERVFATGKNEELEFAFDGPAGRQIWESHVVGERGMNGAIESALVLTRDITKLREAEMAHQEALNRLQKIASQVPGVVYQFQRRVDGTSCLPFASEAIRDVFRCTPEEVREDASKVIAVLHPDDLPDIAEAIAQSEKNLTPWTQEYRVKFPDGKIRWLFGNAVPQREADGSTLWHGFMTDITERREAVIEREKLDRKVQEAQKLESLGVLAGGIAHDFNNLLTTVLGNASLAEHDVQPGSPVQECITQITEAAHRAADLCKQMLAYSGRGRFVVHQHDLGALVEGTAQMLQISISKKAVLRFQLEKNLPPVEVDATQIRQIIMNLVINASEAIGDASGVISISTGFTRVDRKYFAATHLDPNLPEGEYVFLEVSDNGCGMNAETQGKIFDPFFTTKFTGRGLGLAAVLGIVRGHKGAMKVYSEVGRGSTFKLLFPAAHGASDALVEKSGAAKSWSGRGTVLVVDDEETMRSTVARMLERLGLDSHLAADGREAVEIFRTASERFDLVLLDLTMPHMDGEQTFTELRRLRPDVRVVLMSGFNAQEAMLRFTGKGIASFLQKPFALDDLRNALRALLDAA